MSNRSPNKVTAQARKHISRIRNMLAGIDYLCSGTLEKCFIKCGKPTCHCNEHPAARHGPYYRWGHMKAGKLVRRYVSPAQALLLRQAITNYRKVKKLMRAWEVETERLIDTEAPRNT
jgi:hypothetical protein